MIDGLQIAFEPLVPLALLIALGTLAAVITLFGLFRQARGTALRLLLLLVLFGVLSGPILLQEERRYHDDVALVVVDRSTSQSIADRTAQTETALAAVLAELDGQDKLEVRVVEAGPDSGGPADGTHLVSAIRRGLEGVAADRTAGVILISDGQVHDLPEFDASEGPAADLLPGPLHLLLTGVPAERDRRIEIINAPTFAVVDQAAETSIIVHDQGGGAQGGIARVRIRRDGVELAQEIAHVVQRRQEVTDQYHLRETRQVGWRRQAVMVFHQPPADGQRIVLQQGAGGAWRMVETKKGDPLPTSEQQ